MKTQPRKGDPELPPGATLEADKFYRLLAAQTLFRLKHRKRALRRLARDPFGKGKR